MERRLLGHSGLEVSVVGLGCNNFGGMVARLDQAGVQSVVDAAIEAGVTLFDTSDSYGREGGSEIALGEALRGIRGEVVLATKFASPLNRAKDARYSGSRRYIMQAVEDSLRRLQTDWIDLYQYHFPDPRTPRDETLRALDDLVRQGKVRYLGCSNLPNWELVDAAWISRHHGYERLLSTQAEYNLLNRKAETELFPALEAARMTFLPYFPLASGLLTGKYRKGQPIPDETRMSMAHFRAGMTDERLETVEKLIGFAEARGLSLLQLAFAWLLTKPIVSSVIAGATSAAQVKANAEAASAKLSPEDVAALEALLQA